MPHRRALPVIAAYLLALGCGSDDSPAPPEPEPEPDAAPASVRLYDTGSGLELTPSATLVSGSTVRVAAHFYDSLGAPKPLETGETASLSLASAAFGSVTPVPGLPTLWDVTVTGLVDAASTLSVGFDGDDVDEDATFGPFPVTAMEGAPGPITIAFRGAVNTGRFRCDSTYIVGTPATGGVRTKDFRFYVHAVRVLTGTGREVPVTIPDDGTWQQGGTALIDFEDATGMCAATGTAETRDVVVGTVPAGNFDGLAFVIGVPFGQNHLNVATGTSPFDLTEMFWSWNEGYKFLRADVDAPTIGGFRLHLGSTGCNGANDNTPPSDCTTPNRVEVRLAGFDPRQGHVVADLGAMLATTHVNSNTDLTPPGCTSFDDDPDCAGMFAQLGLPFMGTPAGTQQMFRIGAP